MKRVRTGHRETRYTTPFAVLGITTDGAVVTGVRYLPRERPGRAIDREGPARVARGNTVGDGLAVAVEVAKKKTVWARVRL